jgi:hypothetical protein
MRLCAAKNQSKLTGLHHSQAPRQAAVASAVKAEAAAKKAIVLGLNMN